MNKIKIALAQINFIVGDIEYNKERILSYYKKAKEKNADLVIYSELAITGYPPEDLVLRTAFKEKSHQAILDIAKGTKDGPAILIGALYFEDIEGDLYNACFLLENGKIAGKHLKNRLPNYGVFDEKRVFTSAKEIKPIIFNWHKLGVLICEDMWDTKPAIDLKKQGAEILIAVNASPYEWGKQDLRIEHVNKNIDATKLPMIYLNQVGGQDELVFSGGSFVLSKDKEVVKQLPKWQEALDYVEYDIEDTKWSSKQKDEFYTQLEYESVHDAIKMALTDYVTKNHFKKVIVGFSGGIDSALTAALAVEAIGSENVILVMMPSKYTSKESLDDAKECAKLLNVKLDNIAINDIVESYDKSLKDIFKNTKPDLTEENIQSRIRAGLLMAISNKFDHMLLTTGNKSEMAVGYATLYGDMCGGYNILKDLYKVQIYGLAKWMNKNIRNLIPDNIINKAPTAELRPDQKDEDSLPAYDILDKILYNLIEKKLNIAKIAEQENLDIKLVTKIAKLLKIAEYKRRQAPPGIKITRLSFGKDRRYPITNGYNFD